jgi:hypothetical protein
MTAYCNWCGRAKPNNEIRYIADRYQQRKGTFQCLECLGVTSQK